jgi:ABC-2 type transport system permease protein
MLEWAQILRVARREVVDTLRQRALVLFAATLALLLLIAGLVGFAQARQQAHERARLQTIVANQWQNQPDRHPHRVAHYGFIAYRTKSPLSFFDFGVESYTGNSVFLEAHRQNPANFSEARHSTSMLRFGQLSLAYVLQTLLPLLIFFLGFGAITRERENGTLALLVCQGVQDRTLLLGKVLGCSAVVATIWLPTAFLLVSLLAVSATSVSPDLWQRAGLLVAIYTLYLFFWVCVAVLVSAHSRSSNAALLVLLSLWALLFVFVPRTLPNLAERFWPSPSKPEFELALHKEVSAQGNGHDPKDPQFDALKRELLQKSGKRDVSELDVNFNGVAMQTGERQSSEVYERHFNALQELYRRQNRLSELGSWCNPYLALQALSMSLCNTDYHGFVDFSRQAEAYRFQLIDQLNELHVHEVAYEGDKENRVSKDHWREFAPFAYRAPQLSTSLRQQALVAPSLIFWCLLALFGLQRTRLVVR